METIKNYLETMFSKLPNTPEVQKAKLELGQMMEDKYQELIEEGKSENEAVGIVISEFGNLDELAETLGIQNYMHSDSTFTSAKTISMTEITDFLHDNGKRAYMTALGVLLCIISPVGCILTDSISDSFSMNDSFLEVTGIIFLFVCIAIAVGLFITSGSKMGKWDYLKKQPYCTDFAASKYVHEQKENYRSSHSLTLTIGIMLCILSVIPAIIISELSDYNQFLDGLSGSFVLIFVAIGVFMIVLTSCKNGGYDAILKLNNSDTVGGNFVPSQQPDVTYSNSAIAAIMSVYWPTVTCIYLIWSFLTFDWFISWIIWPIAGIIHALVENILGNK